jgi:hypothetical protein
MLKQHWRSGFPACNVKQRNEPIATDTNVSDMPEFNNGVITALIFVVRELLAADVYVLKTEREIVNKLEHIILEQGSMEKCIIDCAKVENSNQVKQILCALYISSCFSYPYHAN